MASAAARQLNESYWLQRQIANEAKSVNYTEAKLRELERHYNKALASIDTEVNTFFKKHADANGKIDPAKASVYVTSNLSRLDQLKRRVQKQLGSVLIKETEVAKRTLSTVYQDSYNKTNYDLQRFRGNYRGVDRLTPTHVNQAISTAWSGRSYSARIWGRHQRLTKAVDEIITQGVTLGHSNERMARELAERMDASFSNAARLVRTESNYVYNQGNKQAYLISGIQKYEFVATLDGRTSDDCQALDGEVFELKDAQVGRNYPPMHVNCRSTTVPYFDDDEEDTGQRIARDAEGEITYVRGDMKYEQWQREFLQSVPSSQPVQADFLRISGAGADHDTVKLITQELELLPASHKSIVSQAVNNVHIVLNGNSGYDRKNKELIVLANPVPGEVIHEVGHAIETNLNLYQNPTFLNIVKDTFSDKTIADIRYDPETFTQPIWLLTSDKLVSDYQGRMYDTAGFYDDNGELNVMAAGEFFSEAYRVYLLEPERLEKIHSTLYQFIKGLLKDE